MARPNDPLDTYLLRVLVTLLTERNLTRVATRMNQTQPAISAALRKLRLVFQERDGDAIEHILDRQHAVEEIALQPVP